MSDLDLRLMRYFTVVARHESVGRASVELHVAQPSLSRQLTELERRVGTKLLNRTPRGTTLTPAGSTFLTHAIAMLGQARAAVSETRAVANPTHFTIGYTTGLIVTPLADGLRQHDPELNISTRHLEWDDARAAVLEHRVDAALTRLPLMADKLTITTLYDEPRMLLLADTHRLARHRRVELVDFAEEAIPRLGDPVFDAYWSIDPRPDGRRAPEGPLVHSIQDKIELIATGQAVAIIPQASGAIGLRYGLVTVPITDIEPAHVVLVTHEADRRALTDTFITQATAEHPPTPPPRQATIDRS